MQDTIAGNTNAGNVMRKKTPREHNMPNENAVHDTFAWPSERYERWRTRVCLNRKIVTRVQETRTASIELEKVCV
jgi:hypothetical protein